MKLIGALAVYPAKLKGQIGYLEYSLLMIKFHYISLHNFDTSVCFFVFLFVLFCFFEGQSDQGVTQLVIKPFEISQISRTVSLS